METSMELLVVGSSPERAERLFRRLVDQPGYSLSSTADLRAAREMLATHPPQLIIALASNRDDPELSLLGQADNPHRIPMLVLLDRDDTAATVQALNAGAIDVLVETPELLERLPNILAANWQTWQQRHNQDQAHEYAVHFGHILASSLTEIYTFDAETLQIIRANRGARENLGYSKQELLAMTPVDLKLVLSREQFETLVGPLRSGEQEAIRFETTHRRKNGSLYPVEVQLQYLQVEPPVFIAVCLDISERKNAEDQLQESETRFRSIFSVAAAGLVVVSPFGKILEANPFFCEFTGYAADELIGRNVQEVTHPEDRETTAGYYSSLRQNLDPIINIEKRYLRKDGQIRWGHASVACITALTPDDTYCIGLVQDITRHKEAEAKLREAHSELDSFVQTVAHDLRTPLTPIIGIAEFLQDHTANILDQTALNFLAEIEKSGHRMLALLEDLLTLARVGHVPQPAEPIDTRQVLEEVLATRACQIAETGVDIRIEALSPLCLPATLVSQLFDNLIGNAIRYAGAAGKPIEVGEFHRENRLVFYVRDHGPGIPEEEAGHIFEVFYRGEQSRQIKGTGVGLATVRKIARLYGGEAGVEPTPGGGSTFWVEFPQSLLSCLPGEVSAG